MTALCFSLTISPKIKIMFAMKCTLFYVNDVWQIPSLKIHFRMKGNMSPLFTLCVLSGKESVPRKIKGYRKH